MRVAIARAGERRSRAARLMAPLWFVAPSFIRSLAWRRMPRSRLQRAFIAELVRLVYERFNHTSSAPTAVFSPRVVARQAPELLDSAGTFHGYEGLEEMLRELREAWGVLVLESEEVLEVGDRDGLLVVVRASNVGEGSGVSTDRRAAHLVRIRDGSITDFEVYWEPRQALEAAGLSE